MYHDRRTTPLEIRHRLEGSIGIAELAGRVTVSDRPGLLKDSVASLLRSGAKHVLLDLSGVKYIDSTRLGELIAAHITMTRQGGRLILVGSPDRVTELLVMAGLGDVFLRFATMDAARASVQP
jgi:anti-sigma B factor antagonist